MPSNLSDLIKNNLKDSMRAGDSERVGVLRLLLAEIYNREKDKQAKGKEPKLDDGEVLDVLKKESKKRKDAIELFRQGGREDLAAKEEKEVSIIGGYLPEQVSAEEIEKVVDACIGGGLSDFGSIMREATAKLKGGADGHRVSEVVKKKLEK